MRMHDRQQQQQQLDIGIYDENILTCSCVLNIIIVHNDFENMKLVHCQPNVSLTIPELILYIVYVSIYRNNVDNCKSYNTSERCKADE